MPRRSTSLVALALALIEPLIALAEPTPAQDDPDVAIVVQGTRPAAASASDTERERDLLGAAPHRTGSDLLLTVPGLSLSQHGGEGKAHQIFFRGFDAAHGQDLEIWAGGAPVNDVSNVHAQGYADMNFVIPEVVRRVSASGGSYRAEQGDFAIAGSARFDFGYAEPGATLAAGLGSFGTRRYFVAYHPEQADESDFAACELYSTDGFGPSRAARRTSCLGQIAVTLESVSIRLLAGGYAGRFDSAGVVPLSAIRSGELDRYATLDAEQGGTASRTMLVADVSAGSETSAWGLAPFVVLRGMELRQNYTGYLVDPVNGDRTEQRSDATTLGARARYVERPAWLGAGGELELGTLIRHDDVTQRQTRLSVVDGNPTVELIDADLLVTALAGYAEARLRPHERLALRAGLRLDSLVFRVDDRSSVEVEGSGVTRSAAGSRLSKRGSAALRVLPSTDVVLSYGEGIRSPQARSLANGQAAPFAEVVSAEAGLRYAEGRRFAASVALFRTALSDDLVFDETTGRNGPAPPTLRLGAVADVTARPRRDFVSSLGVSFVRAEFREAGGRFEAGDPVPHAPRVVTRADLGYRPDLGRLGGSALTGELGTAVSYAGSRPLPYGDEGSDVLLIDLRVGLRRGPVELAVDVENALDASFYDGEFSYSSRFDRSQAASLVPERHVSAGPPRRITARLTLYL